MGRVFANGPRVLRSIPGHVIRKTLKMVLDTFLLNTQLYKVRNMGKVEQSREMRIAFPTPRCRSYWKGCLLVALDYCGQLYFFLYIYIYIYTHTHIYICVCVCVHIHVYTYTYNHAPPHTHVQTYICLLVCVGAWIYMCMYIRVYASIYVYM